MLFRDSAVVFSIQARKIDIRVNNETLVLAFNAKANSFVLFVLRCDRTDY